MQQERRAGIVGRVTGILLEKVLGPDIQPKVSFPLSPEEKAQLEDQCRQIVNKEGFNYKDFSGFVRNMIILNTNVIEPRVMKAHIAVFEDNEAGVRIMILPDRIQNKIKESEQGEIFIDGKSNVDGEKKQTFYQSIFYIRQSGRRMPFLRETVIRDWFSESPRESWEYPSYFNGESRQINSQQDNYRRTNITPITDSDAQRMCAKVYGAYANLHQVEMLTT